MTASPTIDATLALSCFLNVVTRRRGGLTARERAEARSRVVRALAAANGRTPAPERLVEADVIAAVVAVLDAAEALGVANADLAAAFNSRARRALGQPRE